MRTGAAAISLVMIGAALSPLARAPSDDGFPLSTYPMFSSRRPLVQTYHYALGQTAAGERRTLRPALVGTAEVLQALTVLEDAADRGPAGLASLCRAIALRVAADIELADIEAIVIVIGTHDAYDYVVRGRVGSERERARCAVPR